MLDSALEKCVSLKINPLLQAEAVLLYTVKRLSIFFKSIFISILTIFPRMICLLPDVEESVAEGITEDGKRSGAYI